MKLKFLLISLFFLLSGFSTLLFAQNNTLLKGKVTLENEIFGFATIQIKEKINNKIVGTTTDKNGTYELKNIPFGNYTLLVSYLGFETQSKIVVLNEKNPVLEINFDLKESVSELSQIVVTATRTEKKQTDAAVMVDIIDSKTLVGTQSCNLSEGLKFQAGLRVETDCQTCNYTQLRMNGLAGGYSQILINGRPIFSPLMGLYGMEQLPVNMIERIEIVRGGGSVLYGSSAIGGVVNVITKFPKENNYDLAYTYQNINGQSNDNIITGNGTILNKKENTGVSFFINNRKRDFYDHNEDNFSELPKLENNSFGANLFFRPTENQKLEVSFSSINEYRFGGEMTDKTAHLAEQSEERTHNVLVGNIDYQINFNGGNSSFISYLAAQKTDRKHYTGIIPNQNETEAYQNHLENPPYGTSDNATYQAGFQLNHNLSDFLGTSNILTFGTEYVTDDVLDMIEAYNYEIDQTTRNLGIFLQSDWQITNKLNLLSGLRMDKHNFVENPIFSPRLSFLYKIQPQMQLRVTWSTGFRASQAFDADMHLAFAGGGISRISLAENLKQERSNSFSTSLNYDKATENFIAGFTLEGFYTDLNNAFYLAPLGEDEFGERFEKRNGQGATVQGITLETRANYNKKVQLEVGFTLQSSLFDEPVENIEGLELKREFLRTPNDYGFATLSITPNNRFAINMNAVYTGKMQLVHFAGAPEQAIDEYKTSNPFTEFSFKTSYDFPLKNTDSKLQFFGGIKNLLNAYQDDFDTGKNRDSNYVYGTAAPRIFFVGIRITN
ncbi:TonB-dependent receptor [Bernardetia sp.]|uniref:TonB-dependent receptor n=1 Tax=Bernardetia sp. TaxID=1937974 RepID=UPI0025C1F66B|nr:TonB-dependent receptor [Bernardetia sp.]